MKWLVLGLTVLAATVGCDRRSRGMETRSYELTRLTTEEALSLLTPYISEGGYLAGKNKLVSVRDKPDRLTQIEDILRKYDGIGEAADILLSIQVIDADGFTQRDSAIADVEQTLRETFKYGGYKLRGEARLQVREDSDFAQKLEAFEIFGRVHRIRTTGKEKRLPIGVTLRTNEGLLTSTVTATIGKPVVLGQNTPNGAVILVLRTSLAGS